MPETLLKQIQEYIFIQYWKFHTWNFSYLVRRLQSPFSFAYLSHFLVTLTCFIFVGERSCFANKIKAINRLKAKLLVILRDQGISNSRSIKKDSIVDLWNQQTRRYIFSPHKLVQDVKTGIHLPDLNSVLDGNIEPLIAANINSRQDCDTVDMVWNWIGYSSCLCDVKTLIICLFTYMCLN